MSGQRNTKNSEILEAERVIERKMAKKDKQKAEKMRIDSSGVKKLARIIGNK